MKEYVVKFDSTEIVKLVAICSAAIKSEEDSLEDVKDLKCWSKTLTECTERSINKIKSMRSKILSATEADENY